MRHLHHDRKAEPAALCGVWARRTVHTSKARRDDCARCRKIHRARIWHDRAETLRDLARRTEFDQVARDLTQHADDAMMRGAVTILSVRPPDPWPRRSFLMGEIRLAVAKFGGDALADLIVGHLQAGPQLPAVRP